MQTKEDLIKAAFQRLPLLHGRDPLLLGAIATLSEVDRHGSGALPQKFSIANRRCTKKELESLIYLTGNCAEQLETLHQPAILALANNGFIRGENISPEKLRTIAKKAAESDLSWVPEKLPGGRPQNRRSHAVATLLAYYYEMLTGKKPTRSVDPYKVSDAAYGPFTDFVREIFKILGLPVNVEDIARTAIKKRKLLKKNTK